jgi:hypothetical protein
MPLLIDPEPLHALRSKNGSLQLSFVVGLAHVMGKYRA